ncbi:9443_t:CDS:2 [Gigaspora margarita]|uniref:9443_t:CDS:1 n=1 Tax=Gigaspora margarita TaxID=4874 RepID=A0ABN7USA7_GIGMA|nr:9443_t:CDS:2 [Gigaspora margarita]
MTNKQPQLNIKLISLGAIISRLYYGEKELENRVYLYSIRVGWQTVLEISNKNFYTQVLEGNEKHEHQPSYQCQVGLKSSDIEETPSLAIISLYRCVCQNSHTNFFGPQVLGWDDPYILEQSLTGIEFHLFLIRVDKYNIYITALGCPNEADEIRAGVGYTAIFTSNYLSKCITYIQRIDLDRCHIEIYQDAIRSLNALQDQHTLTQLHSQGLLTLIPNDTSNKLWECVKNAYNINKRGQDGRIQILSMIANKFTYAKLEEKLTIQHHLKREYEKELTINALGHIAHSIKRHIRLEYNIQNGDDIVNAIKDIRGTSVANINPSYICARPLPNFGSWNTFSPIDIKKTINNQEFTKPDPKISNRTIPNSEWTIPLPSSKAVKTELKKRKIVYEDKENKCDLVAILRKDIGEEIQREVKDDGLSSIDISTSKLKKQHQEYGKCGSRKHITERVKQLLKTYFLSGDIDKTNRFTASMMLEELQRKVEIGELEADEIPKIKTVENWITRYNQEYKKESAKKELYIPVDN